MRVLIRLKRNIDSLLWNIIQTKIIPNRLNRNSNRFHRHIRYYLIHRRNKNMTYMERLILIKPDLTGQTLHMDFSFKIYLVKFLAALAVHPLVIHSVIILIEDILLRFKKEHQQFRWILRYSRCILVQVKLLKSTYKKNVIHVKELVQKIRKWNSVTNVTALVK